MLKVCVGMGGHAFAGDDFDDVKKSQIECVRCGLITTEENWHTLQTKQNLENEARRLKGAYFLCFLGFCGRGDGLVASMAEAISLTVIPLRFSGLFLAIGRA